jgi:hypothetical protein
MRVGAVVISAVALLLGAVQAAGTQPSQTLAAAAQSAQDNWLPHPEDADWVYQWSDSDYSEAPTKEEVTVKETKKRSFTLEWTSDDQDNPPEAPKSSGDMSFSVTNIGLFNTGWQSSAPPADFPVLCAQAARCNNTIAATYHLLIWGTRNPVLQQPLVQGVDWDSTGGASGDVTSSSSYVKYEKVKVPAFPDGVLAAKVRSEVTQAGALGDPYGSGVRTVWWVYGVGPVKIVFDHTGDETTTSELLSTNQTPKDPPGDVNYFPLTKGLANTYRWSNPAYLTKPSVQKFKVDAVLNESASISVKTISGPVNVAGAYGFTLRLNGLTSLWGRTKAASLVKFPKLGPSSLPADKRRHFFTPFDLMTFGFNPIIPAYPGKGQSWDNKGTGRDFSIYGVTGKTSIVGLDDVKVPAGTFKDCLVVRSDLNQEGFKFGSGTRTAYFAPDVGLVKLVFKHDDDTTSTIELTKTTAGN